MMTTSRRGAVSGVPIASLVIAAMVTTLVVQGAAAAPARTPDQQLVAGLRTARAASHKALTSISPASPTGAKNAATALSRAIKGIGAANDVAAGAVGALQTSSVRRAVRQGKTLAKARSDVVGGRYAAARVTLRRVKALTSAALGDFGVPLEKDFPSSVTTRDTNPYASQPSVDAVGVFSSTSLSAVVGKDIKEVVIGAADRRTANAGEPGAASRTSQGLPISAAGVAFLVEASGQYTTNHCSLKSGLITCRLYSPMPVDRVFMIAFGPELPRGTKLLVKFRSPNGERSYATTTTS